MATVSIGCFDSWLLFLRGSFSDARRLLFSSAVPPADYCFCAVALVMRNDYCFHRLSRQSATISIRCSANCLLFLRGSFGDAGWLLFLLAVPRAGRCSSSTTAVVMRAGYCFYAAAWSERVAHFASVTQYLEVGYPTNRRPIHSVNGSFISFSSPASRGP